ncbi:hypothetical protein [Kocuria palustris]|uniref:hypothetical protein n=1 Tax=Kocuria palustris TaxID=71999 RepID=UPI00119D7D0C|nr:hypothetical protein [Kocuria palustris]
MNPATIHLTCEHCSRPVTGTTGAVRVYDHDLAAAEAAHAAHAAAHQAAVAILSPLHLDGAADEFLRPPARARWQVEHDRCAPTASPAHVIPASLLCSTRDVLAATITLMSEPWIGRTDWTEFVRRHCLGPIPTSSEAGL